MVDIVPGGHPYEADYERQDRVREAPELFRLALLDDYSALYLLIIAFSSSKPSNDEQTRDFRRMQSGQRSNVEEHRIKPCMFLDRKGLERVYGIRQDEPGSPYEVTGGAVLKEDMR